MIIFIIGICTFLVGFGYKKNNNPQNLYFVYLDGQVIGRIKDKVELENYIDKYGEQIKKQYKVDTVYAPSSLEIKKVLTYNKKVDSIKEVYNQIRELKPFTIRGYQFKIKHGDIERKIYTTKEEIFERAVRNTIETFVGKENYQLYNENNQIKIEKLGSFIDNIYLEDNITYLETNIAVEEEIYTDVDQLSKFLLFGTTEEQGVYVVKTGDTIENVAMGNKISVEEFLISNSQFTSKNNLLYIGQEVVIGVTDPQIRVVVEKQTVEDLTIAYKPDYKYDPNQNIGYEKVVQEGENGLERVARKLKTVNGIITVTDIISREELKPVINKIILKGEKEISAIGNQNSWTWPTGSGWVITQNYEYRINPVTYQREFHQALDIAIGYGAGIYASNNGVIESTGYDSGYGNYIIINHKNGYYTLYAHLSKILVSKGQIVPSGNLIGYMGSTGISTGSHLHFEAWIGYPHGGGYKINPWSVLR